MNWKDWTGISTALKAWKVVRDGCTWAIKKIYRDEGDIVITVEKRWTEKDKKGNDVQKKGTATIRSPLSKILPVSNDPGDNLDFIKQFIESILENDSLKITTSSIPLAGMISHETSDEIIDAKFEIVDESKNKQSKS